MTKSIVKNYQSNKQNLDDLKKANPILSNSFSCDGTFEDESKNSSHPRVFLTFNLNLENNQINLPTIKCPYCGTLFYKNQMDKKQ
jgi:uncharacterized Zn-finger protein